MEYSVSCANDLSSVKFNISLMCWLTINVELGAFCIVLWLVNNFAYEWRKTCTFVDLPNYHLFIQHYGFVQGSLWAVIYGVCVLWNLFEAPPFSQNVFQRVLGWWMNWKEITSCRVLLGRFQQHRIRCLKKAMKLWGFRPSAMLGGRG
jgi:hypothetical protein